LQRSENICTYGDPTPLVASRLKMLEGYIAVFIKGKIVFIKFNLRKEIVRFKPLIDMSFGNILPIPPLEVNLFSLGEAIKAFK